MLTFQNQKWKNRKKISRTIKVVNAKTVVIIDLNTSPFRETEMYLKSVIVSTDNDKDKQVTKSETYSSTQTDKFSKKLTTNVINPSLVTSPIVAKTPSSVQPTNVTTNTNEIIDSDDNKESQTTTFYNGADSPYSPGEGYEDEMKCSSPDSPISSYTIITQNTNKSRCKFNDILSILPQSKLSKDFDITKMKNTRIIKSSKSKHSKHNNFHNDSIDDLPGSAAELESRNKFLEKLKRQERVIQEVKLVLKPHYNKNHITKEQYKDIMRKAVPKICHKNSGKINPQKIHNFIEAYVIKYRHSH